jgi:hypothetical protein
MTTYRYYLLGDDGRISRADIVECPTDAAALKLAEQRLPSCGYPAIEIWDRGRRIGMVGHEKSACRDGANRSPGAGQSLEERVLSDTEIEKYP